MVGINIITVIKKKTIVEIVNSLIEEDKLILFNNMKISNIYQNSYISNI